MWRVAMALAVSALIAGGCGLSRGQFYITEAMWEEWGDFEETCAHSAATSSSKRSGVPHHRPPQPTEPEPPTEEPDFRGQDTQLREGIDDNGENDAPGASGDIHRLGSSLHLSAPTMHLRGSIPLAHSPRRQKNSSPEFTTHGPILGFLKSALPSTQTCAVGRIAILP